MDKWWQTATFIVWVVSWMASIWISEYRGQLVWTGLFALVLGMIDASGNDNQSLESKVIEDVA